MPKRVEEVRLRMERVLSENFKSLGSETGSPAPRDSCEGVRGVCGSVGAGVRSNCLRGVGRSREGCSDMALGFLEPVKVGQSSVESGMWSVVYDKVWRDMCGDKMQSRRDRYGTLVRQPDRSMLDRRRVASTVG